MTRHAGQLPANPTDELNSVLSQRYRIERRIARGGMSAVYEARDLRHHRQVAVKLLSLRDWGTIATERFLREIDFTAQLHHPHILPVYDSGAENGLIYYVMPWIESGSLRDRLNEERKLGTIEALRILRDVADAMACAHSHDVVHRDIKPENVMFSGRHAMVADFGVAKHLGAAGPKLSQTGRPIGTPAYMAPEQVLGNKEVDHRADIYSVGVMAYELMTGSPVFPRPNAPDTLAAHLKEAPVDISTHLPDLSRRVAKIIMKCLRKDPARRWQSARKLLSAIESALVRESRAARGCQSGFASSIRRAVASLAL